MRVVIDTSVLIRYLLRPSTATRYLLEELWPEGSVTPLISSELIAELGIVLQRPKLRRYVTDEDAAAFVSILKALSVMLEPLAEIPPFTRDPKDDKFVAYGLSGAAEYLITYDEDLLVLATVDQMRIVTPEAFVRSLS